MFNNPIVDITKGISSLYISGKKRKRSDILKSNGSIANKLKDLKNRFKDLGLMYDELEEQLSDVHFMNISDIKNYKRNTNKKYKKYRNIPNHLKSFNYNYNNLNDYYYNLYKKITNKKQKVTEINKDKEKEKKIYKIDNEISIKFNDTNINTKGLNFGSIDKQNVTNINTIMKENFNNSRPKKYNRYSNQKYRKQNNFIPSGIKIPNKFESNNKILNDVNKVIKEKEEKPIHSIDDREIFLSNNNNPERNTNSFSSNLSKISLASSNSDTIKEHVISHSNKRKFISSSILDIPDNSISNSIFENLSKSTFLEDLNDYVEKDNDNNKLGVSVRSTCSKLNTIPYDSFNSQTSYINLMNESKSKSIDFLNMYGNKQTIKNSSSNFIIDTSTESLRDKKDCIIWDKDLCINKYNNNYFQINSPTANDEGDSLEDISDLTVSSDEHEQHMHINNIYETNLKKPHHDHYVNHEKVKKNKRARKNSNTSENSNLTSTSTTNTEITTTSSFNIEIKNYQDDITYSELLNNPMKKQEICQMEKSHNNFMKSWLDFENNIYFNLNYFIKNDFIDIYNCLNQKSDTISLSQTNSDIKDIPLP